MHRQAWVVATAAVLFSGIAGVEPARAASDAARLQRKDGSSGEIDRVGKWRAATSPRAAASLERLRAELGASWVSWDERTGVPSRIVSAGAPAPGAIASDAAAESFARDLLARHLELLAPGTSITDFELVANEVSSGIRSVGFRQLAGGTPVLGGQVSFRFKRDRLIAIASQAYPHIGATGPLGIGETTARTQALAWLASDVGGRLTAAAVDGPFVLPLEDHGRLSYRTVLVVRVEGDAPLSRWSVYVDASTGEPLARRSDLLSASATVLYNAPVRYPGAERIDWPAPRVDVLVDGAPNGTDASGILALATAPASLQTGATGPLVAVTNAAGDPAVGFFFVPDAGVAVWNAAAVEFDDAQISAFVHASKVKEYVRAIAPDLGWLDQQIQVTTNVDDTCNASSDGNSIFFYRSSPECENTGRIADVVYHEFGHSVHNNALIIGVGLFDVPLSEGTSDYLSATITGDSGLARGFFHDDTPLRELDPPDYEYKWPEDRGEVHLEGRIIGGALWDLRKLLVAKYGEAGGVQWTDHLWYEATRRATDIPSMYVETLVVDDDDGNLANGTPNGCEINAAFGPHGLFTAGEGGETVTIVDADGGHRISLALAVPSFPACPVSASPEVVWRLRGESGVTSGSMEPDGTGWSFVIPGQAPGSVIQYQVKVNYSVRTERSLPANFADPWYEVFVGEVVPLYCTGFSDGGVGWTIDGGGFAFQSPSGSAPSEDPSASWDADGVVLLNDGGFDGLYASGTSASAISPIVTTTGYANVRLQYRRWLNVEDGHFDQASISADGIARWANLATADEKFATIHHTDAEWRFHDVDLSADAADGAVQVAFSLASDGGLELGGWNIDEMCVVAVVETACGNLVLDAGEGCDDGNIAPGDGCDAACQVEPVGEDDGGPGGETDGETDGEATGGGDQDAEGLVGRGCGCAAGERGAAAGWMIVVASALGRRRRRSLTLRGRD